MCISRVLCQLGHESSPTSTTLYRKLPDLLISCNLSACTGSANKLRSSLVVTMAEKMVEVSRAPAPKQVSKPKTTGQCTKIGKLIFVGYYIAQQLALVAAGIGVCAFGMCDVNVSPHLVLAASGCFLSGESSTIIIVPLKILQINLYLAHRRPQRVYILHWSPVRLRSLPWPPATQFSSALRRCSGSRASCCRGSSRYKPICWKLSCYSGGRDDKHQHYSVNT